VLTIPVLNQKNIRKEVVPLSLFTATVTSGSYTVTLYLTKEGQTERREHPISSQMESKGGVWKRGNWIKEAYKSVSNLKPIRTKVTLCSIQNIYNFKKYSS
jgi:hypothetical protein